MAQVFTSRGNNFFMAACEAVAIAAIPCGLMRVPGMDSIP